MKNLSLNLRLLPGLLLIGALAIAPLKTANAQDDNADAPTRENRGNRSFGHYGNDDDTRPQRGDRSQRGDRPQRDEDGADGRGRGGMRRPVNERGRAGRRADGGGRERFGNERAQQGPGERERGFGGRGGGRENFDGGPGIGDERGREFGVFGGPGARGRDQGFGDSNRADGGRPNRSDEFRPVVPGYVGVVTKVKNDREFDIRIDGKTYNVYLSSPSQTVRDGQTVSVTGERIGNNDIRSASLLNPNRRPERATNPRR